MFSHDSQTDPQEMILTAIKNGLDYIAFTDHCDKDLVIVKEFNYVPQIDLPTRFELLQQLKQKYADKIYVAIGLECGYIKQADPLYKSILQQYSTDVIINSIHLIQQEDCYFQSYFDKRSQYEAYDIYLDAVRESLDCDYDYDIVGHIGYVSRKASYPNKYFSYQQFPQKLDDILSTIILKEKALEINTHSKGTESDFLPTLDIIKRYKQLGGKLLTFGSDSHNCQRIAEKFDIVKEMLKQIGFDTIYKYVNHQPIGVKL